MSAKGTAMSAKDATKSARAATMSAKGATMRTDEVGCQKRSVKCGFGPFYT